MKTLVSRTQKANERGQAIVLIVLGFIVLLGFAGLTIDVARLFMVRGQLRRAVDSAGLAAAGQYKLNRTQYMGSAAEALLYSHGFVATSDTAGLSTIYATAITSVNVYTCDNAYDDPSLDCTAVPRRKLIKVNATAEVPMTFLRLIGVGTVPIEASSTAEAASIDVILVLDRSESQAYDAPSMKAYAGAAYAGYGCDGGGFAAIGQDYATHVNSCSKACNQDNSCQPMADVKAAAVDFIGQLQSPYDRVAVISFDRTGTVVEPFTTDLDDAKAKINSMTVYDQYPGYTEGDPCPYIATGEFWKCTSSNLGGALGEASNQFATVVPIRYDSLWTVIVLSSGGADVSNGYDQPTDPDTELFGFCPSKNTAPFCRDNNFSTHHTISDTTYDAEDYAYNWANQLGLDTDQYVTGGFPYGGNGGGSGILMFTIGLGQKVICTTGVYNKATGSCSQPWNSAYVYEDGLPNGGELLLRYLAYIGSLHDLTQTDPCSSAASGSQCGNYYFAPNSSQLYDIFITIAAKIFTRLSG